MRSAPQDDASRAIYYYIQLSENHARHAIVSQSSIAYRGSRSITRELAALGLVISDA